MIERGKDVTYDMKPHRDDPTAVGTSQVADAVIAAMERPGPGRRRSGGRGEVLPAHLHSGWEELLL